MRKVGAIVPLWNQEIFIRPHFRMLLSLDKIVVMLQNGPLADYHDQHGYKVEEDNSEKILREEFPSVEIHRSTQHVGQFGSELFNEILPLVQDCEIVFKLDPDMLLNKKDWKRLVDFIRSGSHDCYRLNYQDCTTNYYMTGDFDHGLRDAREGDIIAFDPRKRLTGILDYDSSNSYMISWEDFMVHHFRGWNKPKSTPKEWINSPNAQIALKEGGGTWLSCPPEIRDMFI